MALKLRHRKPDSEVGQLLSRRRLRFSYPYPAFPRSIVNVPVQFQLGNGRSTPYQQSLYYVWFACLCRSDTYERYCRMRQRRYASGYADYHGMPRGRHGDIYADWGNVFEYQDDFLSWFLKDNRGIRLFAEPSSLISTSIVRQPDAVDWANGKLRLVSFDITKPKTILKKRILAIVDAEIEKYRSSHGIRGSKARYPVLPNAKSADVYLRLLKVWDMKKQGIANRDIHRACYPNAMTIEQKLKAIERKLKQLGEDELADAADAKLKLQKQAYQEVTRDYKIACALIANAARGIFPKTSD